MNLIIDRGNSSFKIAVFENDKLIEDFQINDLDEYFLDKITQKYFLEFGIISSVATIDQNIYDYLNKKLTSFYELNSDLSLPIKIDYKTPQSLGVDRIAAAVGALTIKKNTNLLVVDIGTAITIDFVSSEGIYKGGNISPGPYLRLNALHDYTNRLPLVEENGEIPEFGYDTETAIRSGVMLGIVREIDSYIDEYKKNKDVFAFLTGGYSFYFERKLKNSIFADEKLVLKGLNEILNYQQWK